ncbi:helix-turn-helix domain-containing protein [Streptomyces sp. AK02-04a]|uniref:AraC family transcriptional regulator n=1 Tax=Streptomyces sp. AK02-04a TaxID=3028649 RepID=UPI0029AAC066|nr:helix-turn-helix domain-containing protein [Streptomyces sp. AK02-04a]MDX3763414.1 helix-turn-helix domain-containing protein [Streptomyces sp. AK02-04a]
MSTLVFESDDVGETEEFLSRVYARMHIDSATPASSRMTIRRKVMPSVSVDEFDLGFEMSYSVSPLHRICLTLVRDGTIHRRTFGDISHTFGPGDVAAMAPPDMPSSGRISSAARYTIITLDPDLLTQVTETAERRKTQPIRLTGHRPHSAAAARQLHNTIDYLRDQILADPNIANQPLIVSAAGHLLTASVLSAFPNTANTDPTASDRTDATARTLRRALAFMDEHADEPIAPADIAAATHVTIRSIQYAFRQHLDTTPLAHLRQVRLCRAHDDLLATEPSSGTTVTDIATRWGFFHTGRFAALYRETYGRTPRQALTDTNNSPTRGISRQAR